MCWREKRCYWLLSRGATCRVSLRQLRHRAFQAEVWGGAQWGGRVHGSRAGWGARGVNRRDAGALAVLTCLGLLALGVGFVVRLCFVKVSRSSG